MASFCWSIKGGGTSTWLLHVLFGLVFLIASGTSKYQELLIFINNIRACAFIVYYHFLKMYSIKMMCSGMPLKSLL